MNLKISITNQLRILFLLILSSCNQIEYKKQYYRSGFLKEKKGYLRGELKEESRYDTVGKIIELIYYSGNSKDSLVTFDGAVIKKMKRTYKKDKIFEQVYFKNGVVKSEGEVFNDSLSINWWNFYDKNGQLKAKRHYIVTCGKSILNQSIILNKKGDTIFRNDDYNESTFYDFKVTKLDNSKLKVDYKIIPVSNRSKLRMFYINKDNFCDLETKDFDTIIDLNARTGTCILNANKSNKGIIADYRTLFTEKELKEKGISKNRYLTREMYFDLDDYVVKNMNK